MSPTSPPVHKVDVGLMMHRATQWVITGCATLIVFLAHDIYYSVNDLKVNFAALAKEVERHGEDITEVKVDIKELRKQFVHQ